MSRKKLSLVDEQAAWLIGLCAKLLERTAQKSPITKRSEQKKKLSLVDEQAAGFCAVVAMVKKHVWAMLSAKIGTILRVGDCACSAAGGLVIFLLAKSESGSLCQECLALLAQ